MSYTMQEANALTGRVFAVAGQPYTVQSASTRGEVHVWNPATQTLLRFDSRETFEHWAYGTPVSSAAPKVAPDYLTRDDLSAPKESKGAASEGAPMTDSTIKARIEALPRYDLVEYGGYYRDHQMDKADDGEWMRADDVLAALVGAEPPKETRDDMRVIHSSEIADDPAAFHGDYVPLEDVEMAIAHRLARVGAEPPAAKEPDWDFIDEVLMRYPHFDARILPTRRALQQWRAASPRVVSAPALETPK